MIARVLAPAPALAALLLVAAPARAQAPAGPPVVVVVQPPAAPPEPLPTTAPAPQPYPSYPYAYPATPYPYPPPYPEPPPPLRPRSTFSMKLWAGPTYQRIYDVSMYGADFGVAFGAQRGISGVYGTLEGMAGRTSHGLTTYQYWIGSSWEGAIDRLHLGLGIHIGYAGIERATSNGSIGSLGTGVYGLASVDLLRSEEGHALFLGARFTADLMFSGASGGVGIWGPSASVGWRY